MHTQELFYQIVEELEGLPEIPKIFWYVSAGDDFRGPVFLTDYKINHLFQHNRKEFSKPDLFVFNCLGHEVLELIRKFLKNGDGVTIFEDKLRTTINAHNYKKLSLNNDIQFEVNPEYIDTTNIEIPEIGDEIFYFEIEIIGEHYRERSKVLYFQCENIDFFNKIILNKKKFFEVLYFCTTCEGVAWGNNKKSIIDFIYKDNAPLFFTNRGFKPNYYIGENDKKTEFMNALNTSNTVKIDCTHESTYINKNQNDLSVSDLIYQLKY